MRDRIFDGIHNYKVSGQQQIIAFGDIEGRLQYALNPINDGENDGMHYLASEERFEIKDGFIHVMLGDLFDHGVDDRKLARIYQNTRKFYKDNPEKLFMLDGNRLWTKLRLLSELNNTNMQVRIMHNDTPNWEPNKVTFAEFIVELIYTKKIENRKVIFTDLSKVVGIKSKIYKDSEQELDYLLNKPNKTQQEEVDLSNKLVMLRKNIRKIVSSDFKLRSLIWRLVKNFCIVEGSSLEPNSLDHNGNSNHAKLLYLHWALQNTMSCGADYEFKSTFEYHRLELLQESGCKEITDAEVMQSFIDDINLENGAYRQTIKSSIVALRIDDTLFVHGGLHSTSFIIDDQDYFEKGIDAWIKAINISYRHKAKQVFAGDFDSNLPPVCIGNYPCAMSGMNYSTQEGTIIMREVAEQATWTSEQKTEILKAVERNEKGSVVHIFSKFDEKTNKFIPHVEQKVINFLNKNKITRVVVGHHPYGNSALGFQLKKQGIQIISVDVTRMKDQQNSMCYAKVASTEENSSCIVRAYLPTLKDVVTIDKIEESVTVKAANKLGFVLGTYTQVVTKTNDLLFSYRPLVSGFTAEIHAVAAEAYNGEFKAELDLILNKSQEKSFIV